MHVGITELKTKSRGQRFAQNPTKIITFVAAFLLMVPSRGPYASPGQTPAAAPGSGSPTEGTSQSAQQLQALVAPIALYPDSLVAQILTACTFPDQVAIANYWFEQNKNLTGTALMQAVDKQSWDPSVKALTQFPSVLDNLAKNLAWTSSLGEAYHDQQSEVMTAIQTLRAQAQEKGTEYRNSGIMTFIVGKDGTVLQKDLVAAQPDMSIPQLLAVWRFGRVAVHKTS